MVLSVGFVVLVLAGCAGVVFVRPWYERFQLNEFHEQLDFSVTGFLPSDPVITDSPLRLAQLWLSNNELASNPEQDLRERAHDSLYEWARDHGSNAPREDFAECFATLCFIEWDYRDHRISIDRAADFAVEDVPRWSLRFAVEPQ